MSKLKVKKYKVIDTIFGVTYEVDCVYALEAIQFISGLRYVRTHTAEWYSDVLVCGTYQVPLGG